MHRKRRAAAAALSFVALAALAFPASATTVSFEADITEQTGVSGDFLTGAFEVDASGEVLSLTLDIEGLAVGTSGAAAVTGDLSSALSLVGPAATNAGSAGTISVDWVAAGSGGATTSGFPSLYIEFVEALAADVDGNGVVGGSDFVILSAGFGQSGVPGDMTGDGVVGGPDFVVLATDFGRSAQSFSASAAVTSTSGGGPIPTPEPTSAVLFMVGGLIVGKSIRRRR